MFLWNVYSADKGEAMSLNKMVKCAEKHLNLILETTTKKMHNMDFVDKIRIFVLSNFYM
jgi:hypothetical protein